MKYTVLTYVPKSNPIPKPGEILTVPITEEGCKLCMMTYDGKLDKCWKHAHARILWGRTEEVDDEVTGDNTESIGVEQEETS